MGTGVVMDGSVDIKFLITLGGILFSVAGAAAVGKMQIKSILESLLDVEKRLREIDKRIDFLESGHEVVSSKVKTLAEISSVSALAKSNRETAEMQSSIRELRRDMERQMSLHNGAHPPVQKSTS